MGAVASTFIAGVLLARKGLTPAIGSLSQMARLDVGSGPDRREDLIRNVVPLADLDDLVFGGWDPITGHVLEAARTARVLDREHLEPIADELEAIVPMDAVFDRRWVSRLEGVRVKPQTSKWEQAQALVDDIARFRVQHGCSRLVMVWCGSTEAYHEASAVHASMAAFAQGLKDNDANISPSQICMGGDHVGVPHATAPQPHARPAVHDRGGGAPRRAGGRQGLQDRPDVDEDAAGARPQGAHAGAARVVLDQHPGQPRR
jgi:myo-inositol-1-phosphate synthase